MAYHNLRIVAAQNSYHITHPKPFNPVIILEEIVNKVFDFAYNMSFGRVGEHRDHRTGGQHRRRNGEIFANTFQGKLAEFYFHSSAVELEIECNEPDVAEWALGRWDPFDFVSNEKHIAVKSTKNFGNLLLLETGDWNSQGQYLPNLATGIAEYDFLVLVRISPDANTLIRTHLQAHVNNINRSNLFSVISAVEWKADIAGFITKSELINHVINATPPLILPQNSMLNGRMRMDAENYYVQAGDMHNFDELPAMINAI